jgi:hypothetical protein
MALERIAEVKFAEIMGRVLSPSRAIDSPELLKGRDDQLREIRRAWYQGGRQIFIYGYRGVGKTSLAQTAAYQHQSSEGVPIRVICEQDGTFNRVVHDIFSRAFPSDPRVVKQKIDAGGGLKLGGLSAEIKRSIERGDAPEPKSINEAVQITEFLLGFHSREPVIIIDEFDRLKGKSEQAKFAAFVKEIGDRNLRCKLIFCGIGESIDTFLRRARKRLSPIPYGEAGTPRLGAAVRDYYNCRRCARDHDRRNNQDPDCPCQRWLSTFRPSGLREVVLGSLRSFCERDACKAGSLRGGNQ